MIDDAVAAIRTRTVLVPRAAVVLGSGPMALVHRIVDTMVDNYRPEVNQLEERLDDLGSA